MIATASSHFNDDWHDKQDAFHFCLLMPLRLITFSLLCFCGVVNSPVLCMVGLRSDAAVAEQLIKI